MIRWCAYCLRFLAEEEPLDRHQMSYDVCSACKPRVRAFSDPDQARLENLAAFYIRLEEISLSGGTADVRSLLDEGRTLGLRPIDLMMGMLQPLLEQIGNLWTQDRITVAVEHRFSSLVADLMAHVWMGSGPTVPPTSPALFLVNAEENHHTLGVLMAEAYFATQDIPILAVAPGLPTREIIDLIELHRPKALGFSVALPTQMHQVCEVALRIRDMEQAPRHLLVGGPAVRLGLAPDPSLGIEVCRDLAKAQAILGADPLRDGA